jgi:hypothetical protein
MRFLRMRSGRPGVFNSVNHFNYGGSVGRGSHFGVPADKEFALARVDTVARERVDLDLLYSGSNVSPDPI